MGAQDISNTLWAYATLQWHPGQELMQGAARQATLLMPRFKPQEVANTLWSYATLSCHPGTVLLDTVAAHMTERIQHFRPQVHTPKHAAAAQWDVNPTKLLRAAVYYRELLRKHSMLAQMLCMLLSAHALSSPAHCAHQQPFCRLHHGHPGIKPDESCTHTW